MSLKRQSITAPDLQFSDPMLNRLMQFVRAQAQELQALQQMLRAGSEGQSLFKSSSNDYDAGWVTGGAGTVSGAENLGPGAGVFKDLEGPILAFKSLVQGTNVVLTVKEDTITISAVGGGGGGSGTVTSVGIASADLDVTGSPVETSGSITLAIKANAVSYDKLQQTTTDGVVLGRRTGEGAGEVEELGGGDLIAIIGGGSGYAKQLAYAGIV